MELNEETVDWQNVLFIFLNMSLRCM